MVYLSLFCPILLFAQTPTPTITSTPTPAYITTDSLQSISAGEDHTCGITTDANKSVYCWGYNGYGQLGNNSTTNSSIPLQVKDEAGTGYLTGVSQVSLGYDHTCAVTTGGVLYCWGDNDSGKLGNNLAWYELPQEIYDGSGTAPCTLQCCANGYYTAIGNTCSNGVGLCATDGNMSCKGAGVTGAVICDAVEGSAGDELCNGYDDDCDGEVDEGEVCGTYTPTITSTATFTETYTPSNTFTGTYTPSNTFTETYTPSNTFTETYTPSNTFTKTYTRSNTFTKTYTPSNTVTGTYIPLSTSTETYTPSNTKTYTPSNTFTETYTPSNTSTETYTPSNTFTETYTPSNTFTKTYTRSNTFTKTYTPSNTFTKTYTSSNTFTKTYTPSNTFTKTYTPSNTSTKTHTPSNTFTKTYTRSRTFTKTYTPSSTVTGTYMPLSTATETFTPSNTFTLTATPLVGLRIVSPMTILKTYEIDKKTKNHLRIKLEKFVGASLESETVADPKASYKYIVHIRKLKRQGEKDENYRLGRKKLSIKKTNFRTFKNLDKGIYSIRYQVVISKKNITKKTKWTGKNLVFF